MLMCACKLFLLSFCFSKRVIRWENCDDAKNIGSKLALLHIVPFCEGPNKKPEGFAKQKQPAIFAMRHASHLVVHQPSLIYNVP